MKPKLNFAHVCDQVIVAQDTNNVTLVNLFNEIRSKNFPAIHPRFSIISNTSGPEGKYKQEIEIIDPDGNLVASSQGEVVYSGSGPNNFIVNFINFIFQKQGKYSVRIKIGEDILQEEAASILVKQV